LFFYRTRSLYFVFISSDTMQAMGLEIVYINPEKCTGCRSCEMACAVEHSRSKDLYEAIFEEPTPKPRLKVVAVDFFNVPMRCLRRFRRRPVDLFELFVQIVAFEISCIFLVPSGTIPAVQFTTAFDATCFLSAFLTNIRQKPLATNTAWTFTSYSF